MATYYYGGHYSGNSNGVWAEWNAVTTSSSTTNTWKVWCDGGTTIASDISNDTNSYRQVVWGIWNDVSQDVEVREYGSPNSIYIQASPIPVETPEQITQRAHEIEEQARIRLEGQKKEQRDREAAEKRANRLLLSLLNRRQRREYKANNQITIYRHGTRTPLYFLEKKWNGNILEYDPAGKPVKRHCVHPVGVPIEDVLATQYLYLQSDPAMLFKAANTTLLQ